MSEPPTDQGAGRPPNEADDDVKTRAKSIGEVASPLLAGFSFTNVIVLVISGETGHFLLPGEAIISWTIASVAFIVAVQVAKFAVQGSMSSKTWTDRSYHLGVVTFLLGFGLALAPQLNTGAYVFRWIASGIAFAAAAANVYVDVRRELWPRKKRPGAATAT